MSQVVIVSKVAACTSQPVVFNEHPSTRGHQTGLRNKPQKSRPVSFCMAVVLRQLVSLMIELRISIGDEKRSLPLCAYVASFGKPGHI